MLRTHHPIYLFRLLGAQILHCYLLLLEGVWVPKTFLNKIYNVKKHLNASEARNLGYEKTASDYLLFIDSDVILTENGRKFVQNLDLSILNNKIIGGIYAIDDKANQISNINSLILIYRFLNFKECNENCESISSSHFIISKKKFAELGLFNENLNFFCAANRV